MRDKDNPREGPSTEQLAYLAAIIDGEGCITIERTAPRPPRYPRSRYWITVVAANTNYRLMEHLDSIWPGFGIYVMKAQHGNRKTQYVWRSSNRKALALLQAIRPYLILKGEQADVLMEFQHGVTTRNYGKLMPQSETDRREALYQRIRVLNKTGTTRND